MRTCRAVIPRCTIAIALTLIARRCRKGGPRSQGKRRTGQRVSGIACLGSEAEGDTRPSTEKTEAEDAFGGVSAAANKSDPKPLRTLLLDAFTQQSKVRHRSINFLFLNSCATSKFSDNEQVLDEWSIFSIYFSFISILPGTLFCCI